MLPLFHDNEAAFQAAQRMYDTQVPDDPPEPPEGCHYDAFGNLRHDDGRFIEVEP